MSELRFLCSKHGADLLVFSGRHSLTRINDAVNNAKAKDKPIAIFYISDLDIAGWNMPKSFLRRTNEIYPDKDNIVIRVTLTRKQANMFNLPAAFETDDKDYSEVQKQEFIDETGSTICIELDALPEDTILQMLEAELSKYSGLELDNEEYEELIESAHQAAESFEDSKHNELEYLREEYNTIKSRHDSIVTKINDFFERIEYDNFMSALGQEVTDLVNLKEGFRRKIAGEPWEQGW